MSEEQKSVNGWEPRILGFLCNWCSYAGADLAGVSRFQYPPTVRIIRVMCSARVEPAFVLRALLKGVDGVLVLGCHFGDCHYISGNYRCRDRMEITKEFLNLTGVDPERLYLGWVSAAEGQQFAQIVAGFTDKLTAMGPLSKDGAENNGKMRESLTAAMNTFASERIRWLIGERESLVEGENVYGEKMSPEDYQKLLSESLADEYKCSKIALSIEDEPLSVREIADRTGLPTREVLPYINLLKENGRAVQADVMGRSPRYIVDTGATPSGV
ncbi:hydrogenase iron-sulfur subunit [Candidatus Poribacteria bacterium]